MIFIKRFITCILTISALAVAPPVGWGAQSALPLHLTTNQWTYNQASIADSTPTPVIVLGSVNQNANLRSGPGVKYAKVGGLPVGTRVRLTGTNSAQDWVQLESGEWIAAFLVDQEPGDWLPIVAEGVSPITNTIPSTYLLALSTATPGSSVGRPCAAPPGDMTRVQINGETVNARTLWMLNLAQQLYGGPGSLLRVVQGSYEPGLADSFGTHDGGGAVDISIRNPVNPAEILWDEAPAMVTALRQAGFAAWYRPTGMFGPSSGAHIHAIAIGDSELSVAAQRQLNGPEGYFRGLDGVPPEYGGPHADPHGDPVICPWMLALGLIDGA